MTKETSPIDNDDVQDDEVIGTAFRISILVIGAIAIVGGIIFGVSQLLKKPEKAEQKTEIQLPEERAQEVELPTITMTDITSESGIDWVHVSGMEGEKLLPETMGGGVAIFDYDNDDDNDILFVGGSSWPWSKSPNPNPRSLCLYQNDGKATFTDVTAEVGLDRVLYGMAPCIGDFDNDGWTDLYITAVGENILFQNKNGQFTDVTATTSTAGPADAWSTAATWLDYDNDGLLDLFVCDYVLWKRELDLTIGFSLTGVGRAYGQPTAFTGTQSHLFHNDGQGKFTDVSAEMGIEVTNPFTKVPVGKGLGVSAVDVNHDGWTDIMVANDTVQNFLFMNLNGEEFVESGVPMGIAFDKSGTATGAMGVDCGYFRNDDSLAIAIGNFANEPSSLYVSTEPESPFADHAMASGLGPVSRLNLTFGMVFADLDLDNRLDIVCSNGHLESEISVVQSSQSYEQPPQFFWNAGPAGATELVAMPPEKIGPVASSKLVGRGVACGDLDNDGDLDLVLIANSGMPMILRNDQSLGHHWLRLRLTGNSDTANRSAYGSVVTLQAGGVSQRRILTPTRSYLSQCEPVLTFGLGQTTQIDSLNIRWPDGSEQELDNLQIDQLHQVQQPQ